MGKTSRQKQPAGSKRHPPPSRPNIESGLTKPGVRRLTQQAGITRRSADVTLHAREEVPRFLEKVLRATRAYQGDRKTTKVSDVVKGLAYAGFPIYSITSD